MYKRIIALLCFALCASAAQAQSFRWSAALEDSVIADGFYNIVLRPEIGAKLQDNYSDIRILNEKNEEIPFVHKSEEPYFSSTLFKEYPIVSNKIINGCCTKLTIENTGKKAINNICFVLKNSDAVKVNRISGSDDGITWYAVKQFDVFYNNYSETDTKVLTYVHFPLTDYLYYSFDITDRGYWNEKSWIHWENSSRWNYPVNVLKVGFYETFLKEGKYKSVPAPTFEQQTKAEEKRTYIKVSFADQYLINRIRFNFSGPRYYKREITLATKVSGKKKQGDMYIPITTLEVNSYSLNEFDFSFFREKEFYILIENDDNRPLELKGIETWQLTRYLKTYLEKGHQYRLAYSDSASVAPVYDLNYFVDSIPKVLPTLLVLDSKKIDKPAIVVAEESISWYENKLFVWLAIAALIALLSFMSWKMLGEMKKDSGQ
ncbi:hypothetical protein [Cytophaga aurantiaca]|uniref:hypothetical protein n=1 Tax=Cytophaga aurantiaca TaxID=29530 RepID=UPI00036F99E5|nr:hypothetical protein [Cytophaga aurantiaca]